MRAELPANAAAAGNALLTGECHGRNNACRARDVNCRHRARRRSPRRRRLAMQHKVAIGERTATAMQHKPRQGEYTGGWAPYGRRVAPCGARLEPDPDEEAA